jgi:hypothetical protein
MESTGPQSGENRTLKVGHPRLHLNPILPFEPAPEPKFLKILTPMPYGIYLSGPLGRVGDMLQNRCKVRLRRDAPDSVCAFRGPICLRC